LEEEEEEEDNQTIEENIDTQTEVDEESGENA
jgi:hypothetical protein